MILYYAYNIFYIYDNIKSVKCFHKKKIGRCKKQQRKIQCLIGQIVKYSIFENSKRIQNFINFLFLFFILCRH